MKISCSSPMVPGKSITEKAMKLKKWGYDAIALFVDYETWTEEQHQEVLQLKNETDIIPCEFVFSSPIYGHLMDEDPELRIKCRDMYKKAATICGEIGAVTELEFEYKPQDPLPVFEPYAKLDENQKVDFLEIYLELLEPLKGTKGKMLLENINRYESKYLNTLNDCKEIVDLVRHENAGILADLFHMSIEEKNIPDAIKSVGHDICHVHLGDNNRLLPGYGSTDWEKCFSALKAVGYRGFVNLECSTCGNPEKTLPQTAVFLKELIG